MPSLIDAGPYAAELIDQVMGATEPSQRFDMALALQAAAMAAAIRIGGFDEVSAQVARLLVNMERAKQMTNEVLP